jgi:hypothetical protein
MRQLTLFMKYPDRHDEEWSLLFYKSQHLIQAG